MSDPIDAFVRAGVSKYAEAQQAVSFFRKQVFKGLEAALTETLVDGALVLGEKPDILRKDGDAGAQCWIDVFANVVVRTASGPRRSRIDLGVWWNPTNDPAKAPCVVYANLYDDDVAFAKFPWSADAERSAVRAVPSSRYTRLCVTIGDPPDIGASAAEVLAAIRSALNRT